MKNVSSITSMSAFIVLTHALCGCAETQRITYSVENVPRAKSSNTAHLKLVIAPLRDNRLRMPGNRGLFTSSNETTIKGTDYCINAEEGYEPHTVPIQISEMLAAHLRKRGTLRAVSVGAPVTGAYYLSGTLNRFYGVQTATGISTTTVVLFGLAGAAVSAAGTPDTTPGLVWIEIVDLALYDGSGRIVATLPNIEYTERLAFPPLLLTARSSTRT